MANADHLVNNFGVMTGWNNVTVNLLGRDVVGITSLTYKDNHEKVNAYGAGRMPVGRGYKKYSAEASITLYKEEVDALKAALVPGARIQDIAMFDITVEYARPSGYIQRDRVYNAEFTNDGVEITNEDGTISIQYTLIITHIGWDIVI
ncbi:hypothetical protein ETU08_01770 [Apibacter muscae]|nr:hypothetical protein ETU08_01770 [Apibacter muscae]